MYLKEIGKVPLLAARKGRLEEWRKDDFAKSVWQRQTFVW